MQAMLETIAIKTVWGKAFDALKRIPWFVWVALAILALWWIDRGAQYREGLSDGREAILAEFRAAEAEALKKGAEKARKGDLAGEKRALEFAEEQAAAIEVIEKAEIEEGNALDAIF